MPELVVELMNEMVHAVIDNPLIAVAGMLGLAGLLVAAWRAR